MKSRPAETEYAESFKGYVARVPETDAVAVLEGQAGELGRLAAGVAPGREKHRYAEGKWSIREVIGHLIDSERVFAYRAFCISRGDKVSLPGFEENDYVAASHYDDTPLKDLVAEFTALRSGNMLFFRCLREADWERIGTANGSPVSVRALAFIIAGHVRHHIGVLRDRYGVL
ncbi:MAG TPA: DinB family protein [Bacteroidota bacterium]|nr:DinB family protein [Bacteroidota bacterium]